eukprot:3617273-Lingulodinium_polyedra.AAC.1
MVVASDGHAHGNYSRYPTAEWSKGSLPGIRSTLIRHYSPAQDCIFYYTVVRDIRLAGVE